ncbi:glycosyltransferase family 2 protein [Geovibrio thiophilus]|uniref:Glycosyltransferase family 2 protein n=1 Tax=Geovibrio thiophilus TaxID=139438 RepID=A0A410K208_9BACT|nr:glycosyltransferase family 2 protein [Geovibrio thiophilus]
MKVSAVIPVYNRTETLKDAVESVLFQDYSDIEIIVVDDGSETDLTVPLKPYMNMIRFIRLEKNSGVSRARNEGIKAARGDFISFLDSDDVWLPFKISHQMEMLEQEQTKICHTNEFWYRQGKFINQSKKHARCGGYIFPQILDICRISDSSVIIAKEVFARTGMFDEGMRVCEDYDLFLRVAALYEVSYSEKKCIIKRSVTNDQLSAAISHIESVRLDSLRNFICTFNNLPKEYLSAALAEINRKEQIVKSGLIKR